MQQTPSPSSSVAGFLDVGLTDSERLDIESYESELYNLSHSMRMERLKLSMMMMMMMAKTLMPLLILLLLPLGTSLLPLRLLSLNRPRMLHQVLGEKKNAEKHNRERAISVIVVEVECYIQAGSRDKLVDIAEREWTMYAFLQSHIGSGHDE